MVKAVQMNADGTVEEIEQQKPELQEGDVLLKTEFSEVCGTDIHLRHGRLDGVPYPIIPGHVSVGQVSEIKGTPTDIDGNILKVGDKVTFLDVAETCNNCYYCLVAKASTRCPNRKVYGITYGVEDNLKGGWSQYIYLPDGVKIIRLPPAVDPRKFIAAGCGLPTALHAVQRANIQLGDTVVIQGSGPVGLMAAILARVSGAFGVIMVGAPEHRLSIALDFGVDRTINIEEYDSDARVDEVISMTKNRGADVTIEATGNPIAVKEGMQMTRDQGTYVIVGQYTDAGDIPINPHLDINKKHLTIKGSWGSDFEHFYLSVKFMSRYGDEYPFDKIISKIYKLDEIDDALRDVEELKVMKAVIDPQA